MLFNDYLDEVVGLLKPEYFYVDAHQRIYRAILRLHEKRKPFDVVTVADAINRTKEIPEIGGVSYLHDVLGSVPHAANSRHYAGIIRDQWMLRELQRICHNTLEDAYASRADAREVLDTATAKVFGLLQEASDSADTETSLESLIVSHHDEMCRRLAGENPGVESGFKTLDSVTNGFGRKRVYVVAARPGVGKTALLCKMLMSMSASRPLFFSLEQPKLDVADRLLSIKSGLGLKGIQRGQGLTDPEIDRIREEAGRLAEMPIHIDDRTNRTIAQLTATARIYKRKHHIGIVLIDYLQLIAPENRRAPEHEQVAEISRGLLSIAKELDVPIVALAQMNREVDKRQDRKPKLSDLRGSGAIEQDAYLIAFLDVPSLYNPEMPHDRASLIIAKHRNGELGEISLNWQRETVTFTDEADFTQAYGGFMSQDSYWRDDNGFGSDPGFGKG